MDAPTLPLLLILSPRAHPEGRLARTRARSTEVRP